MSTYFISAADVLYFRDGREIKPGSEYTASSLFPPSPSTIYGAIRSALLSSDENTNFNQNDFGLSNNELAKVVGKKDTFGSLEIKKFSFGRRNGAEVESLFKVPNDILKRKKPPTKKDKEIVSTTLMEQELSKLGISTNLPNVNSLKLNWFKCEEGSFFEYESRFLSTKQFADYLKGSFHNGEKSLFEAMYAMDPLDLFKKEQRIGITLNYSTNTVEEGMLFTTPFIRLNADIGFCVELDKYHLVDKSRLRLGGDGKLAFAEQVKTSSLMEWNSIKQMFTGQTRFKLVLTTAAIFEKGWIPDGLDSEGIGVINDVNVKMIGASLGRYQNIGGWDLENHQPKPTKRAVPAGSVYYFELSGGSSVENLEKIHGKSICQNELKQQGFGISYIGVYH